MTQITFYEWPQSHLCTKCKQGEFFRIENNDNCTFSHFCAVGCTENNGRSCPSFSDARPSAEMVQDIFAGLVDHYAWAAGLDIDEIIGRLAALGYVRARP